MSVLQIIKDLIGKQDINWGDSSAAFSRQTHAGGSINMNYIDAECIPSTALGGFVGTYLHAQHTDTGTTSPTFDVSSGSNRVRLSASGLSADRTYTFPDASQELAGTADLASVAATKGASLIGLEDSAGFYASTNVEGALAELGNSLANQSLFRGAKTGFNLGWLSVSSITIGGGMWHHAGATEQYVHLNAQTTFLLGSAGSNSNSDDLGTDELHYIYLDDAAIQTIGPALTAACIKNKLSVPSYSHAKGGWYSSNDRCIGAILTNGSSQIVQFLLRGLFVAYQAAVIEYSMGAPHTVSTALDLSSSVPKFSTRAVLSFSVDYPSATVADRHIMLSPSATGLENRGAVIREEHFPIHIETLTDTNQQTWWRLNDGTGTEIEIHLAGYYIDTL